jgi:hypothetical protein
MWRRLLFAISYLCLTLLVLAVTFALVAYGNDYTYDFSTHHIIQKGHVIINSSPGGVRISEGGRLLNKKTPYQAAYKVGAHTFSLVKDGFWTWQKTLQVVAGQVTLARYVILVPKKPQTTVLDTKPTVVAQSISKDHRHLAYITSGADAAVYTLDLGNPKPFKLYAPKVATATQGAEALMGVTWSDDASHLVIVSTIDGQPVHRLAAASGGEPEDLTSEYGFNLTGLQFSASNWRQLYWISPDGLRRLDADTHTVSAVLADKVSQFWVVPDRVLYAQQTDLGRSLWALDSRGRHQQLIQALAVSDSYSVAYANYLGEDELAVVPSKTQVGTLYSGIYGDTPVAKTVARGVTAVSFSPDGHLAAFGAPDATSVYDLEQSSLRGKLVQYSITDQPGALTAQTWFDNYHLLSARGTELYWSEFDGANRIDLGSVVGGFPGYATSDARSVVLFGPSGAASTQVAQLLIKP